VGDVVLRPARDADLPAIVDIYNHWVKESPVSFDLEPTTVEAKTPWFATFAETGRWRILVAEMDGEPAAYAYSHQHRARAAYDRSVETSVYVDPRRLGLGLGRALMIHLLRELEREDVHRAFAGVTLPNDASVTLHESLGYRPIGTFSDAGFKFGRYWSVAWFERPFAEREGDRTHSSTMSAGR
jgi:phosphinothricin acetyltransferase